MAKESVKRFADTINALCNRDGFYDELLELSDYDLDKFCIYYGQVIQYYIETRDTNISHALTDILFHKDLLESSISPEDQYHNAIVQGFFTHSCSGNYKDKIKIWGLGNSQIYDKDMYQKLLYLEEKISAPLFSDDDSSNRLYFCSPGTKSIHYAINYSPERLHIGLLRQTYSEALPIIVGESKTDYYKRVLLSKIPDGENIPVDIIDEVISHYLKESPVICFFPIFSSNYTITPYMDGFGIHKIENLSEYITSKVYKTNDFFSTFPAFIPEVNGFDNLFMLNTHIPAEDIGIIQVPSRYDLVQMIARKKGAKNGELASYQDGSILAPVTLKK